MQTTHRSYAKSGRIGICVLAAMLSAACIFACQRAPVAPVEFSMGQPIPMGDYTITITHIETGDFSAISGLGMGQGTKGIAVYMTLRAKKSIESGEVDSFKRGKKKFSLKNREGETYTSDLIMFADAFRMQMNVARARSLDDLSRTTQDAKRLQYGLSQGTVDLVILFGVPFQSQGHTLLIENTRPRSGQPRLASVSIGR